MTERYHINGQAMLQLQCGTCGVYHAMPAIIYDDAARLGGWWHCPNGHQRGWAKGREAEEINILRRERDRLKQDAAQLQDAISDAERRAAAAERKTARVTKRAHAGVCQCCNRSFANVARHMKTQHPEIAVLKPRMKAEKVA